MTTTLYCPVPYSKISAQGYDITQAGTVVPDNLVQAIVAAAANAGVTLTSSAGGTAIIQSGRSYSSGTGAPSGDNFPLGWEIEDSTGATFVKKGDGTWVAGSTGSYAPVAGVTADVMAVVTAGGALTAGKHNPVNAAGGSKAMTLADATSAGQVVSFEKTDSSANTVTLTLNLRGTPSSTLTLYWQNETIELRSKADGSWWPTAGHKTKSSIDSEIVAIGNGTFALAGNLAKNVRDAAYGATGNGTTEDASAITAAITAAGVNGAVYFPAGSYLAGGLAPLNGQTWFGPGVIKRKTGTDAITVSGKTGVTLDVTIDGGMSTLTGNAGAPGQDGHGVNISSSSLRIAVRGRFQNIPGNAVRISDSSWCSVTDIDVYNCLYGVGIYSGGSVANPSGGAHFNMVRGLRCEKIGWNAYFISGRSDSQAGPNAMYGNSLIGLIVRQVGDTAVEVGQGAFDTVVSGIDVDGNGGDAAWNGAYNGVLIRDASRVSLTNFTIKNFASFANGNGVLQSLGNGVYVWPQYTGICESITISTGVIQNCSRGVYAQGNNTTAVASTNTLDGGGAGTGGQSFAGCKVTGVTVDGTQLGILSGSWATFQTALNSHGFYIQSVSGWDLANCVARNCQNNGFQLGDSAWSNSYITDVTLTGCRAQNSGQQAITGQSYSGFNIAGTSSQANVRLNGCRSNDHQASGSKTQQNGYRWNSLGGVPRLVDCTASGHSGTYTNGGSGTSFNGTGTDLYGALGGSIVTTAGTYSVGSADSTIIWNGTTAQTVTLPSASFSGTGRAVRIRNVGTIVLGIAKSGGGTLTKTSVATAEDYTFITDGTNWY